MEITLPLCVPFHSQVFIYSRQSDQDWNYIKEERRWHTLNDESSWRRIELEDGKQVRGMFHIR